MEIRDLAVIGDRKTCALISKAGDIVWHCPDRFDKPAFFTTLLDAEKGGFWSFKYNNKEFKRRYYKERSGVLYSEFSALTVTDFMPISDTFSGICRLFSEAPDDILHTIYAKPYYGIGKPEYEVDEAKNCIEISRSLYIIASHRLHIKKGKIEFTFPAGDKGWAYLSDKPVEVTVSEEILLNELTATTNRWKDISKKLVFKGPYEAQVNNSLRAIQLMTYEQNGAIIAAATTSLPEVIGGSRNYDYRYVWLRDSAMITSAMLRAESNGEDERSFLSFLCDAKYRNSQKILLPFYTLDKLIAPPEEIIPLSGYKNSRPVRIGNDAMDQLQLDANANVLIAAKLIYNRFDTREHWETVESIAEFLVERWSEEDHGIWEEKVEKHFTSSKVIVAKALEFISDHSENYEQKQRWLDAAQKIRNFVRRNCMTSTGAFATYAGSETVDITASLYPIWLYCEPDSPEMKATIQQLEQYHKEGNLYHRTLELYDASKEGVFLSGCLWMAQYYLMLDEVDKCKTIIDSVLEFSTDLGFFSEEGDTATGEMLGNFPQTFVHASFIGTVIDLKKKLEE